MPTNPLFRVQPDEELAEAHRELLLAFVDIDRLQQLLQSALPLAERSVLWLDDRFTRPYQTSHAVNYLILTAVDHLHCLKTVMQDADAQHIFAPFTLIRSAIETASTALWLLNPKDRKTRITRSLRLEANNIAMLGRAYGTMGVDVAETTRMRLELLSAAVEKSQVDKDVVMGSYPSVQTIISTATKEAGLSRWIFGAWQLSSGSTHGKTWAGAHTSTFTPDAGSSTEDVFNGCLSSDEASISKVLLAALAVINRALRLQARRARRSNGGSFNKTQPCSGELRWVQVPMRVVRT
ncbi:hypothetical protein [Paenarthrobacter sp. C1]|uniref:hypothetical protein n=1 Tax=Paenarthrobacter sp. C1 TaxID=3400220 RepID=UPI003BF4B94E